MRTSAATQPPAHFRFPSEADYYHRNSHLGVQAAPSPYTLAVGAGTGAASAPQQPHLTASSSGGGSSGYQSLSSSGSFASSASISSGSYSTAASRSFSASGHHYAATAPAPLPSQPSLPQAQARTHALPRPRRRGYHHRDDVAESSHASDGSSSAPPVPSRKRQPVLSASGTKGEPLLVSIRSSSLDDHHMSGGGNGGSRSPGSHGSGLDYGISPSGSSGKVQWTNDTRLENVRVTNKPSTPRMSPKQKKDLYVIRPDLVPTWSGSGSESAGPAGRRDDDDSSEDGSCEGERAEEESESEDDEEDEEDRHEDEDEDEDDDENDGDDVDDDRFGGHKYKSKDRPDRRSRLQSSRSATNGNQANWESDYSSAHTEDEDDNDDDSENNDPVMQVSDRMLDSLANFSLDAEDIVKSALIMTRDYAKAKIKERFERQRQQRMVQGRTGPLPTAPLQERAVNSRGRSPPRSTRTRGRSPHRRPVRNLKRTNAGGAPPSPASSAPSECSDSESSDSEESAARDGDASDGDGPDDDDDFPFVDRRRKDESPSDDVTPRAGVSKKARARRPASKRNGKVNGNKNSHITRSRRDARRGGDVVSRPQQKLSDDSSEGSAEASVSSYGGKFYC